MVKVKNALKILFALFKESILLFFYTLIMGSIALIILMIDSAYTKWVLEIIAMGFFALMCIMLTKSFGERQYNNKVLGAIRREKGNAEDIKKYDKPQNEYKALNGVFLGLMVSTPLYLLLLINLILGGASGIETATALIYCLYSAPMSLIGEASVYYLALFTIIPIAACQVGYQLGARKIKKQQKMLQDTHEQIYGKGN